MKEELYQALDSIASAYAEPDIKEDGLPRFSISGKKGKAYGMVKKAIDKLGQLEDVEEKLGIDLVTLFKAMKDGVYISDGHNNIEYQSPSFLRFTDCFFQIETDDGLYDSIHLYKDYGKTWALTKEELK